MLELFIHPKDKNSTDLFEAIKCAGQYSDYKIINLVQTSPPDYIRGVPTIVLKKSDEYEIYEGTSAFEFVNDQRSKTTDKQIPVVNNILTGKGLESIVNEDISRKIDSLETIKITAPEKSSAEAKIIPQPVQITEDKI